MSTIMSTRERELQASAATAPAADDGASTLTRPADLNPLPVDSVQNLLRQKEAELKQANAELEERGKLLYKTKVWLASTHTTTGAPSDPSAATAAHRAQPHKPSTSCVSCSCQPSLDRRPAAPFASPVWPFAGCNRAAAVGAVSQPQGGVSAEGRSAAGEGACPPSFVQHAYRHPTAAAVAAAAS
jgi:hypothetical protein